MINLPGINLQMAKNILEHLNSHGGGISLDEAKRIIGREVNSAEVFNIETQYSLSAYDIDPGYFMAAYSQEKEGLQGKGLFQAVTAVSASTSQFNPPEYYGNLDPNYRLDRAEINARNNMYYDRGYGGVAGEFGGDFKKGYNRNPDSDFMNKKGNSLSKHFNDHNADFNYASEKEYLNGARSFLEKTPTSTTQFFTTN